MRWLLGALTLDLGIGRTTQPLGPREWRFDASRERVYELLTAPYAERRPRAMREKVEIWERAEGMVLAAHRTEVRGQTVVTVETVRFEPPELIAFRLVRGPVPHLTETLALDEVEGVTTVTWSGELGTDFGPLGAAWGRRVARAWETAVNASLSGITAFL